MAKKAKKSACVLATGIPDMSRIVVTDADIRLGKGGDAQYCPIARAVRRQLGPKYKDAKIDITGSGGTVKTTISMPVPQICVAGKLVPITDIDLDWSAEQDIEIALNLASDADNFVEQFDGWKDGDENDATGKLYRRPKPKTFKSTGIVVSNSW